MRGADAGDLGRPSIADFARRWQGLVRSADGVVRAELADLCTRREPWRARALEDAAILVRLFYPIGIGLEIDVLPPPPGAPFEGWVESIAPLEIETTWCQDMSGTLVDWQRARLGRVALEDGAWRVVEVFWSEEARRQAQREAELVAQVISRRS